MIVHLKIVRPAKKAAAHHRHPRQAAARHRRLNSHRHPNHRRLLLQQVLRNIHRHQITRPRLIINRQVTVGIIMAAIITISSNSCCVKEQGETNQLRIENGVKEFVIYRIALLDKLR
nr:hypothetical protein [Liquorilactobacillus sucicola]